MLYLGNMDSTTSEATSSYSTLEMTHAPMYNQSNHTYQWNSQQQMNEGMTHSHANQDQFLQRETLHQPRPSHQPRQDSRRATRSEEERKECKRLKDVNYRQRKKDEKNAMIANNKRLQEENERLSTENRHLKEESARFKEESLQSSTENRQLKEETERLTLENKHLEERIRGLQRKGHLPAELPQMQDSYISQSTSQVDHPVVSIQDLYEMEINNEDVYRDHHWRDFNHDGVVDGSDGMGINDLQILLFPGNEMIPNGRVAINEPAPAHQECSHSGLSPLEMAKTEFLAKLDAEVMSNVDFSDFVGLEEEQRRVGRHSFPVSLIPTVERINKVYGDVSATCLVSPSVSGTIYVWFCATVREMEHLQLEEVTKDKMLKWRDAIKDALRLNFNVQFAMEHLKKIARAYYGQQGLLQLHDINERISSLEAVVNDLKKKHYNIHEEFKVCIDAAKMFTGVPVSTGLFTLPSSNTTMRC